MQDLNLIQIGFNAIFVALLGYLVNRLTRHQDKADDRLEKSDERLQKVVEKFSSELKHSHDRHEVNDRVMSSFTKAPYDSSQVAKGLQPYPSVTNERRN